MPVGVACLEQSQHHVINEMCYWFGLKHIAAITVTVALLWPQHTNTRTVALALV